MPLKIAGIEMKGPKTKLLVIPRDGFDIPFRFVAVSDDAEFEALCAEPIPPKGLKPGGGKVDILDDPGYIAKKAQYGAQREAWYVITSLAPSNIEWDTVKREDPSTWCNWRSDLRNAGFSVLEINTIYSTFLETNMVTDEMLNEARDRFLASQQGSPSDKQ